MSLVLALSSLVAIAAAACGSIGATCEFDSDCSGGSLCIEQTCYVACSDEQDCEPPYDICQAHTRQVSGVEETVKACVGENFGEQNGGTNQCEDSGDCCTDDAECIAQFGDDAAVCGIDNRCIIPVAPPAHGVLIRDRSVVDTSQEPQDGGFGADIAAIFVRHAGSQDPVGFGVTLDYAPANAAGSNADIFDGSAPSLDEGGQCVTGAFEESTVSLGGTGGTLLVAFEDADGRRLELNSSWEVVVIEWGANCGQSENVDTFDVYFCSREPSEASKEPSEASDASGGIDPNAHCERQLNVDEVSGFQVLNIGTGG